MRKGWNLDDFIIYSLKRRWEMKQSAIKRILKNLKGTIMQTKMNVCVLRHTPPILCPDCKSPTVSTWDSNHRDKSGKLLHLRGCPECNKVFTPEPELKLIRGLTTCAPRK